MKTLFNKQRRYWAIGLLGVMLPLGGWGINCRSTGAGSALQGATDDTNESRTLDHFLINRNAQGSLESTGYYSNVAAEFEAVWDSRLRGDFYLDPDALERLRQNPQALSGQDLEYLKFDIENRVNEQIRYAMGQFLSQEMYINLAATDVEVKGLKVLDNNELQLSIKVALETTLTNEVIEKMRQAGISVNNWRREALVPDQPYKMPEMGARCSSKEDAEYYNYFYYVDFNKPGCEEAMREAGIERVSSVLELKSAGASKMVFPEYDRMIEDQKLTAAIFFGYAGDAADQGDVGYQNFKRFKKILINSGFSKTTADLPQVELTDDQKTNIESYQRKVGTLTEQITVVSPLLMHVIYEGPPVNDPDPWYWPDGGVDLGASPEPSLDAGVPGPAPDARPDSRPFEYVATDADKFTQIFRYYLARNDLVFYNGHSGYGGRPLFEDKDSFAGRYQIFFLNSCYSYGYYTKQIFRNNNSEGSDENGWNKADVVNNLVYGYFSDQVDQTLILVGNLLRGAEFKGREKTRVNGRTVNVFYSWDRIVGKMNQQASAFYQRLSQSASPDNHFALQLYGVSGVTTNSFVPSDTP